MKPPLQKDPSPAVVPPAPSPLGEGSHFIEGGVVGESYGLPSVFVLMGGQSPPLPNRNAGLKPGATKYPSPAVILRLLLAEESASSYLPDSSKGKTKSRFLASLEMTGDEANAAGTAALQNTPHVASF